MTKEFIGDVCAYVKTAGQEKANYPKVGSAFQDGDRLSIKLDCIPLPHGWTGWLNIFPPRDGSKPKLAVVKHINDLEDDIPF